MIALTVVTCVVMICIAIISSMIFLGAMMELQDGEWGQLLISIVLFCAFTTLGYIVLTTFREALRVANY